MTCKKDTDNQSLVDRLIAVLVQLPWPKVLNQAYNLIQKVMPGQSGGIYEVPQYESTLELKDRGGQRATFHKRERVRYLQDRTMACQDQAWGDGEILLNYRCTPGTPVDRYRSGYKTYILISRREVKKKGDVDEFNIGWSIRQGFLQRTGQGLPQTIPTDVTTLDRGDPLVVHCQVATNCTPTLSRSTAVLQSHSSTFTAATDRGTTTRVNVGLDVTERVCARVIRPFGSRHGLMGSSQSQVYSSLARHTPGEWGEALARRAQRDLGA